ncbi:MAG: hypothetical protein HYX90_09770, partial [Chloroflexi bacterium]|nr:hypothetical protein [Chloroflexota bacterium]
PEGSGLTIASPGTLELGPYHVTPIPTVHSLHVKSQGYLIESEGERLLYTGDLVGTDPRSQPLPGRLDLVITDGSFIRRGGLVRRDPVTGRPFGHAGIPDLVEFFRRFTPNILFVHFGSWFYHDIAMSRRALRDLGRSRQVRIIVGYDGMQLDLATLAERG